MVTVPLELVELIIDYAWGCLSTISSHQHAQSMTRWMLVSHDWLKVVLSVVFRDLWITSYAHLEYILHICRTNSFVCELAGITDVYLHLTRNCRSLMHTHCTTIRHWKYLRIYFYLPLLKFTTLIY
jgi:hypothetical protein